MLRTRNWAPWAILAAAYVLLAWISWERWADPIVDCGREIYLPWQIAEGKMLYRDLFFMYGPLAPYGHALLFKVFGVHLNVLYTVGLALAAAQGALVYVVARRILSSSLSCLAAIAFLVQFAFRPTISNLVFPYSFDADYASALNLAALWAVFRHRENPRSAGWLAGAGVCVGLALLAKQEIGLAGFFFLVAYLILQRPDVREWALSLVPSILLPLLGYGWFAWRLGPATLVHDYLFPWRLLREMKFFELYVVGTNFEPRAIFYLLELSVSVCAALLVVMLAAWAAHRYLHPVAGGCVIVAAAVALVASPVLDRFIRFLERNQIHAANFFLLCVILVFAWRRSSWRSRTYPALWWIALFALLATWRAPLFAGVSAYSSFYMAASVIVFVWAWAELVPRLWGSIGIEAWRRCWMVLLVVLCLLQTGRYVVTYRVDLSYRLSSPRGVMFVHRDLGPALSGLANFLATRTRPHERVLLLPEETSLYFLCNRTSPFKYDQILPAFVPTEADERALIASAEAAHVRIIAVSNRTTTEYGKPYFGIDYCTHVREWLLAHYHLVATFGKPVRPVPPPPPSRYWPSEGYGIEVYERN